MGRIGGVLMVNEPFWRDALLRALRVVGWAERRRDGPGRTYACNRGGGVDFVMVGVTCLCLRKYSSIAAWRRTVIQTLLAVRSFVEIRPRTVYFQRCSAIGHSTSLAAYCTGSATTAPPFGDSTNVHWFALVVTATDSRFRTN